MCICVCEHVYLPWCVYVEVGGQPVGVGSFSLLSEPGLPQVKDQSKQQNEFQHSLNYQVRPCLKEKQQK